MEVQCKNCGSKLKIADDKLPTGKAVSLKCPKCESKIEVDKPAVARTGAPAAPLQTVVESMSSDTYDAALKSFDLLEEGVETVLICEHDDGIREKIRAALEGMKYHITETTTIRDALKYIRMHSFDLVVLDEGFDSGNPESNYALGYLAQLPTDVRRDIFVLLVGNGFSTGDDMTAFNRSVNFTMNLGDMEEFERILRIALADHRDFYRMMMDTMKKMGRA